MRLQLWTSPQSLAAQGEKQPRATRHRAGPAVRTHGSRTARPTRHRGPGSVQRHRSHGRIPRTVEHPLSRTLLGLTPCVLLRTPAVPCAPPLPETTDHQATPTPHRTRRPDVLPVGRVRPEPPRGPALLTTGFGVAGGGPGEGPPASSFGGLAGGLRSPLRGLLRRVRRPAVAGRAGGARRGHPPAPRAPPPRGPRRPGWGGPGGGPRAPGGGPPPGGRPPRGPRPRGASPSVSPRGARREPPRRNQ